MATFSAADRDRALYSWLTTAEVGRICGGVSAETVLSWIKMPDGLKALNVGTAKRPVYRIKQEWADEFLRRRTVNG